MTQEELTMTVPTSRGNIEIYIPGSRDVIVKMSGGADSSILMLLLAKYRQEINPELKFKIVTTISTAKPYQYIFAKQVLEFINNPTLKNISGIKGLDNLEYLSINMLSILCLKNSHPTILLSKLIL